MPITKPHNYSDKTTAWTTDFLRRRAAELAPLVTKALIEEHRRDPRGAQTPHSHELKLILDFIHNQPTDGKSFVYAAHPNAAYRVGVMHGRDAAPSVDSNVTYDNEREAVHAVFLQRLEKFGLLAKDETRDRK